MDDKAKTYFDLIGFDDAKSDFTDVVAYLKSPDSFASTGRAKPGHCLVTGGAGYGKTTFAQAVAMQANVPSFTISRESLEGSYSRQANAKAKNIMNKIKDLAPCLLVIDDIETFELPDLGSFSISEHESCKALCSILQDVQALKGVAVIATANDVKNIEAKILNSGTFNSKIFDKVVDLPLPDKKERLKSLINKTPLSSVGSDIDWNMVADATEGFTHRNIDNLMSEAIIGAEAASKSKLDIGDVNLAFYRMTGKKLLPNGLSSDLNL
jgi:cell division protease FtsH